MATQQDLQELLRLLTVSRKVPMMQAMGQIKALQAVNLRSIQQIAEAPLETVTSALKDEKQAKSLQSACKAAGKSGAGKRGAAAEGEAGSAAKRARQASSTSGGALSQEEPQSPAEIEASLALPVCTDERRIAGTVLRTNRAPLVLAFAVELLRYTMPEQPPSSRLSLAQAVVSANSRSKAVSIGIEKGPSAEDEGWGQGQPRVRVMGREVAVLKRGGYEWRGEEDEAEAEPNAEAGGLARETQAQTETQPRTQSASGTATFDPTTASVWAVSQPLSLKKSTFVARATHITDAGQRQVLVRSLLDEHPHLRTATHNAWAYRVRLPGGRVREEAFDDGETGCGDLMLRILRDVGADDTLVVLTRWYGGVLLGPDRWRLMRQCVTGALAERLRKTSGGGVDDAARVGALVGGEAVWGLDLEAMRGRSTAAATTTVGGYGSGMAQRQVVGTTGVVGMQVHRPESARNYLLRSFETAAAPAEDDNPSAGDCGGSVKGGSPQKGKKTAKKMTARERDAEREENLGLLLGALRLLYDSWADHLSTEELDRRAWSWYVAVRPAVESGPSGWGAKGLLRLQDILDLRRKEQT